MAENYPQVRAAARFMGAKGGWGLVDAIQAEGQKTSNGQLAPGEAERLVDVMAEEGLDYTARRVKDLFRVGKSPLAGSDTVRRHPVRYAEEAIACGVDAGRVEAVLARQDSWTLRTFHTALTGQTWTKTPEEVTPEQEQELLDRAIAQNPELVAKMLVGHPEARTAFHDEEKLQIEQETQEMEEALQKHLDDNDPIDPRVAAMEHLSGPMRDVDRVKVGLSAIRLHMPEWDEVQRSFAAGRFRPLVDRALMLLQALDGVDDADMQEALQQWSAE